MKFLYSDTQDYVDPAYDFIKDENAPKRRRYWDDRYAHELFEHQTPYDGLLIAMSAVRQAAGVAKSKVRYSTAEEHRLLRVGARDFLRFNHPKYCESMVMGDCGAFAYVELEKPPYSTEEVVDFYIDGQFTHGVSPDHIIFACDTSNPSREVINKANPEIIGRYEITLENAQHFLKSARAADADFEPVGAVQGWSPKSMAKAAVQLEKMGYRYLAIGGLVPLKNEVIHQVLDALREAIKYDTEIHLLGFAKADTIDDFVRHNITSFDSTSPLIRAFKDEKANYYMPSPSGKLEYYAAIRIPQAIENSRLMQGIKEGVFSPEDLQRREQKALTALRKYATEDETLENTLDAVMDYQTLITVGRDDQKSHDKALEKIRQQVQRTLNDRPWEKCQCDICTDIGVEVIIFRSNNRNRRRGFHNLAVYHKHLQQILGKYQ